MTCLHLPLPHPVPALIGSLVVATSFSAPALAHNVEVADDVAATMHIEPNHNPRAGEPSLAWFALTRAGGSLLPLEECNCQLKVYAKPNQAGSPPILQPPLRAINAEQYRNIPGTDITFPKSGQYILELNGRPKDGAQFKPFSLRYTVTVTGGNPAPQAPANSPNSQTQTPSVQATRPVETPPESTTPYQSLIVGLGIVFGVGIVATVLQRRRKQ